MGGFLPNEICNTFGMSFDWTSKSGFGLFAGLEYYCLHPEKPWGSLDKNIAYYDSNKYDVIFGARYTFN